MVEPPVTIGVPVYNAAERIADCLKLIQDQRFGDFRVIVSDNASTDETSDIVSQIASQDSRIELHRHSVNMGALANFQFAMQRAKTPFFLWRADDDHMSADFVGQLYRCFSDGSEHYLAVPNIRVDRIADNSKTTTHVPQSVLSPTGDRIARIQALMRDLHPSWFYGLWRTVQLKEAFYSASQVFGQLYASDPLILLAPVLDDAICGDDRAEFVQNVDSRERKQRETSQFAERIAVRDMAWLPFNGAANHLIEMRNFDEAEKKRLRRSVSAYAERHVGLTQLKFVRWQLRKLLSGIW